MTDQARPTGSDPFFALAPATLPFYRTLRYDGGAMGVQFNALAPAEQAVLRQMYAGLQELYAVIQQDPDVGPASIARLLELYRDTWEQLLPAIRELGQRLVVMPATAQLRQVFHDIKGGAFQALAMYLQLIALGGAPTAQLHRMFFLARDQLKIMRNALPEIDPDGIARDEADRLHAVELLVEKWQQARHALPDASAAVEVRCFYTGAIAERCLEFAALDRVIYNLVNNAVRHSADDRISLTILPIPAEQPHHLRFVVANPVQTEQRAALEERFPAGLGPLFLGGFTTGGNGLGLRICADFVCNAYGLRSVEQGLAEGHFGAVLQDDQFIAWVHWPIAAD